MEPDMMNHEPTHTAHETTELQHTEAEHTESATVTTDVPPSGEPESNADANDNEDEYEQPCTTRYNTPIKQLEAIINLPPERRHYHAIKRIVESREAWSIVHTPKGWLVDDYSRPEQPVFYLWPAWEYAQMWLDSHANAEELGYSVRCMTLSELMLHILPMAIEDHVQFASFFLSDEVGIIISPEEWKTWVDNLMVDWYGWDYIYEDEVPDYR